MMSRTITRRTAIQAVAAAAVGLAVSPFIGLAAETPGNGKKILLFTRSQDFPHTVVTRKIAQDLAFAEKLFQEIATKAGYDVTVSKDGTIFEPDRIGQFDAFAFYTTGDLTKPPGTHYKSDQTPAMSVAGKAAFLAAIESGKGFLGLHSATDTFHSTDRKRIVRPEPPDEPIDPYIAMLGGEFLSHGSQQKATIRIASHAFPGLEDLKDYQMLEEWYGLVNLAPDMHVILIQDTTTMTSPTTGQRERQYQRDPYPETWARNHGKGRVFYTSMGHRDDVWTSELYQRILLSALAWTSGNVRMTPEPNLAQVCPGIIGKTIG
jgi:hypothetical protein